MKAGNLFHVGIVTHDPDATRAGLTARFGYEWGPQIGGPVTVTLPDGIVVDVEMSCAYSITTPRLEVVRSIPGTFWEPVAGAGIHHLGYWSDDIAADAADLVAAGYETEATRGGPDGPSFAFLRSDAGFRVELVGRASQAGLERCWAPAASEVSA